MRQDADRQRRNESPVLPRATRADVASEHGPERVLELQRQVGNQAVVQLLSPREPAARDAVAQRSVLEGNTKAAERAELEVLTLEHVSSLSPEEVSKVMNEATPPNFPADEIKFGSNIDEKIKLGLTRLAVEFAGNELRLNSVVSVPLDLSPFGGVNGVYRFVRIQRKAKPQRLLIIDRVADNPPADPATLDIEAAKKRFTQFGFTFGAGFTTDDDQRQLLAALARVPDAALKHAQGVTFIRRLQAAGAKDEPGNYDPATHTITLFGSAQQRFMSSADAGGADWFTYALSHELGHAVDFEAFVAARMKRDRITQELAELAKRPKADPNAALEAPGEAEQKERTIRAEINRLTRELARAETELGKASPGGVAGRRSASRKYGALKGGPISEYGKGGGDMEDFAELFAIFALDPPLLKSLRPDKFKYFDRTFR